MSNSDASSDTPIAAPAANKPSLMGEAVSASSADKSRDKNTRMLMELESLGGHRKTGSTRTLTIWLGAAALVAAAGAAWWSQQRSISSPTPKPPLSSQAAALPAVAPTAKVAEGIKAAARPVPPASAPTVGAPSVARIETVPTSVAAATTLALASAAPALATTMSTSTATSAPQPAKARAAKPAKTSKSIKTAKQKKRAEQKQLAKAKKGQTPPAPSAHLAKASSVDATGKAPVAASASKDADILLLSALLAHVSRDTQGAPSGPQAQQTIAQIVQRCEARGGKDSVESAECRRRICEGYWGKAQACPANLAPKKE